MSIPNIVSSVSWCTITWLYNLCQMLSLGKPMILRRIGVWSTLVLHFRSTYSRKLHIRSWQQYLMWTDCVALPAHHKICPAGILDRLVSNRPKSRQLVNSILTRHHPTHLLLSCSNSPQFHILYPPYAVILRPKGPA